MVEKIVLPSIIYKRIDQNVFFKFGFCMLIVQVYSQVSIRIIFVFFLFFASLCRFITSRIDNNLIELTINVKCWQYFRCKFLVVSHPSPHVIKQWVIFNGLHIIVFSFIFVTHSMFSLTRDTNKIFTLPDETLC